jgi:hypothetical protein
MGNYQRYLVATGCTLGLIGLIAGMSAHTSTASASLTPVGKLIVESNSQAQDVGSRFGFRFSGPKHQEKVSAASIVQKLDGNGYLPVKDASSIQAVYAVVSGLPRIMVNPDYIKADPEILVHGDLLDDVPVWVVTFNGVKPPIQLPKGQNAYMVPNSHTVLFDANTGDPLMGYSGS